MLFNDDNYNDDYDDDERKCRKEYPEPGEVSRRLLVHPIDHLDYRVDGEVRRFKDQIIANYHRLHIGDFAV